MAFPLSYTKRSGVAKSSLLTDFLRRDGELAAAAELHPTSDGQASALRGRRIQRKQTYGSSLPLHFLFGAFVHCSLNRAHRQIPLVLPHASALPPLQKVLPLIRAYSSFPCLNNSRSYNKDVDPTRSDSEPESDCENESSANDCAKLEVDRKEVDRVCQVIDETFAVDRNMEAVLDECQINLTHELVLAVLDRFKHARKPAFRFFIWAGQKPGFDHDSNTYNAMMNILSKARQFETMAAVFDEMGSKGLLTMETFTISIKAFAASKERKKAIGIFDQMRKYNFEVGVETINCLLDALCRAKLAKEAQAIFEKMEHKFTPNVFTYTILLNGWCRVKNLMEACRVWNEMIEHGLKPDVVTHNTMLDGLLTCGKRSDAIKLFEVMRSNKGPNPNVRSYTILINYLCKHGYMNEAVNYFDDMIKSGCAPDPALYTCLITGFAKQKKMDMVQRLLNDMKEKGCPPDGQMYNALIKMMTRLKMPDDAVKIYKKMIQGGIQPSIHTYNMIMKMYFVMGDCKMGRGVWEEMKRRGICPDDNSYTVLVGGLIRLGRSEEACGFLKEMIDKGMKAPRLDFLESGNRKRKFPGISEVADVLARWGR
ncbi:pentatricopeptide repeat (PPR) superfamily protein [Striga asiatica]|uniref:Pentatricopeptide repeat (PPR) superfamily protein n=1 Tax=Striga asiatica TaxID=4170 RepID=A0A5A7RCJ9_STRAF|nr:pentatricopeptide repeat (PPR) superfamily protein [Striga asiatica]